MNTLAGIRKEKQVIFLVLARAFQGIRDNIHRVIWQPFALSLGLPMTSIGALSSLTEFSRIIIMPILGAASDRYGRKKFLIISDALILLACIFFIFAKSWLSISVGMILIGLSTAFLPIWQSTIAESAMAENIGYVYSVIGSAYMLTGMLGTFSSGYVTDFYGYQAVYGVLTLFSTLSILIITWKINETGKPRDKRYSLRQAFDTIFMTFKPPKYMRGYYIAMSVDRFAFSLGWHLLNGMLTVSYGFSISMLGIIITVSNLCRAVFQVIFGRYVDRVGYVKYMALSQGICTLLLMIIYLNQSFNSVLIASMLMGLAMALWGPADQAWLANNVDPEERAGSIGVYSTFRGLIALPGPFIGGILFDAFGYHVPIGVNLVLSFLDIFLIIWLIKEKVNPKKYERKCK
jgi:MFS family permease